MSGWTGNCVGVLGRLFGHKYVKSRGGYVYRDDNCFRCGKPKGYGWRDS